MFLRLSRLFRFVGREFLTLWYACRSPETPWSLKAAAVLLGLYALSPIDFAPDWIPLLGWVDDVTLLTLAIPFLLKLAPQHILNRARMQTDGLLARWRF